MTGNANRIGGLFDSVPGHALIIRGDRNSVIAQSFAHNQGDAIRIEGGELNTVDVTQLDHNDGNGITLTGGASANQVRVGTGVLNGRHATPGTGNRGHGIALIGEARFNHISTAPWGSSANGGHGLLLDGTNVTDNSFLGILCELNQGNGVTLTNGATYNNFDFTPFSGGLLSGPISCNFNGGSGVAVFDSPENSVNVTATGNTNHGLHLSGVHQQSNSAHFGVAGTTDATQPGNGGAGVRLDRGTSGVTINGGTGWQGAAYIYP